MKQIQWEDFDFNLFLFSDSYFPTVTVDVLQFQVTHRLTHQLVARIFAIFFKEIIDFDKIEIDDGLDKELRQNSEKTYEMATMWHLKRSEHAAINPELWISPDPHIDYPDNVFQGSSLSHDYPRYGLFIQESFGARPYSYSDFISTSPIYTTTYKDFILDAGLIDLIKKNVEEENGTFVPSQCNSATEP